MLSLIMVLSCGAAADEIYVPDNLPASGSTNVIPFKSTFMKTDCRYQALYKASYFNGKSFSIKELAFAASYTGNLNTSQMQIRLSHFTGSVLSATMDQNIPNPVAVLDGPHTYTTTAGLWCPIGLTARFVYNGTDNLVLDIRYKNGVNSTSNHGGFRYTKGAIPRNWAYGNYNAVTRTGTDTTAGLKTRFTVDLVSIIASGKPSPGGTVDLDLNAPGNGGLPYLIGSSLGKGPIPIDTRKLHLSLDAILDASVNGYLPMIFQKYSGYLDASGKGQGRIIIPNIPLLIGVNFYNAFVTLKAGAPSGLKSISPSVLVTVIK